MELKAQLFIKTSSKPICPWSRNI